MENSGIVAVFIVPIFISIAAIFFAIFYLTKSKLARVAATAPVVEEDGSVTIPLAAAFTGWKGVPWVTSSKSDIRPMLTLGRDTVKYRVIRAKERPYGDIAAVDARTGPGTANVILEFNGSVVTFVGNAVSRKNAAAALTILAEKGCRLTDRAKDLIRAAES